MDISEYNPYVDYIILKLKCSHCGKEFVTEGIGIPNPDWSSETHHGSVETDYCELSCENCGSQIDVTMATGIYGGEVNVENAEILSLEECYPDSEIDDEAAQQLYDATHNDIEKALDAITHLNDHVKMFMYRLLYANAITSMESYLSETLKREVLRNEDSIRRFTETYKPFSNENLCLSELFKKKEQIPSIISAVLKDLMYHNLGKLKPIFKDALDIDLGVITPLCKAVDIRHDLVHRNGKNHDGVEHNITEQDVRDVLSLVKNLVNSIDSQFAAKRIEEMMSGIEGADFDEPFRLPSTP